MYILITIATELLLHGVAAAKRRSKNEPIVDSVPDLGRSQVCHVLAKYLVVMHFRVVEILVIKELTPCLATPGSVPTLLYAAH